MRDVTAEQPAAADIPHIGRSVAELLAGACADLAARFGAEVVVAQWESLDRRHRVGWPEPGVPDTAALSRALGEVRTRPVGSVNVTPTGSGRHALAALLDAAGTAAIALELHGAAPVTETSAALGRVAGGLATEFAARLAAEHARAVSLTLQHAMLGTAARPHGFCVRSTPSATPREAGGDWSDVVEVDDGRVGVVVGDCAGHDIRAAGVLGELRAAGRALLRHGHDPGEVLSGLDEFAHALPAASGVTAVCAVIDTTRGTVRYSSAGHPPPVLVGPDHAPRVLDMAQDVPLAARRAPRPVAEATLPPGATLVLYTDGLVARRGEALDTARVRTALDQRRGLHPERVADELIAELAPDRGYDDDVAVLTYRQPPADLSYDAPGDMGQLAVIRSLMRAWLPLAAVAAEDAERAILAVGEAAANTVEHGQKGLDKQVTVGVSARCRAGRLEMTVWDDGVWQAADHPGEHRGNGLKVIEALMDVVTLDVDEDGTRVTMQKELHS
jgi:anti-sigma regulatory factor (Ser/Thr protein kinase)